MLPPGTLLRQRYRLERRLAAGGMGAVYAAIDEQTGRTVAVKQQLGESAPLRYAFEREAHLLSQLKHPALPRVEDFFADNDGDFLVMTFVPGDDLGDQLARRAEPFPLPTVLTWADQILDLLTYLHTRQPPVIHRDIKPRNLKLDAEGRVVLLDFGLARGVAGGSQPTLAGYTLQYAPLEQVRGERLEPRSDLYALGATLYELLTRRPVVDAPRRAAAIADRQPDPLQRLDDGRSPIPASVAVVISQALLLHPRQRPATARAMRVALCEAASNSAAPVVRAPDPDLTTAAEPPSGTVTFLATELTEEDLAAAALARHDALVRRAIDAHQGYILSSSLTGVTAAFGTADAALAASLMLQRALRAESVPLEPHIALHTGAAELRGGEYASAALPLLHRMAACGHPSQMLAGRTTRDLLVDSLPDGTSLRHLGSHRLPDAPGVHDLFQVLAADLPAAFPPLRTRDVRAARLPSASSALLGREREVSDIVERLRHPSVRLLTLTGAGGVGKTRLALHAAEALLDDFADGVYFVPLAAVRGAAEVVDAIARVVDVKEQPGQTLQERLRQELRERDALLILDNFEQLAAEAASTVGDLLAETRRLKIGLTSRVLLRAPGEYAYAVQPLAVPALEQCRTAVDAITFSSVQLFVERARAVNQDVVLDDASAPAIGAICERLDGLPLAIELAAARVDLFAPHNLLARLDRRLPLLAAGQADRPARHQTLRATLAWSFGLLGSFERELFAQLSVFAGGWSLDAGEATCAAPDDAGLGVAAGLEALAAASLVQLLLQPAGELRYSMLETVREFAAERLAARHATHSVHRRHADYFAWLAETADAELGGARIDAWLARLDLEHNNLRVALQWLAEQPDRELGLRLGAALWRFWQVHGHLTEGRMWLERLLEGDARLTSVRARALVGAGVLAWRQLDRPAAITLLHDAVEASRTTGEAAAEATALKHLGLAAMYAEPPDFPRAAELFGDSLELRRMLNDRDGVASCLNDLAVVAMRQGDYADAEVRLDESLALCRELGNRYGLSFVLNNLSLVYLAHADYERVAALLHESLTMARELGSRESIGCSLTYLASVAAARGPADTAARLFGAAEALREGIGVPLSPLERITFERHLTLARTRLDSAAWEAAFADGRVRPVNDLIDDALRQLAGASLV